MDLVYRVRLLTPGKKIKSVIWVITFLFCAYLGSTFLFKEQLKNFEYRVYALAQAIYWEVRAFQHSEDGFGAMLNGGSTYSPIEKTGGSFLGVTEEGELLIDTYEDGEVSVVLADLIIDDAEEVAKFLEVYKYDHVFIETYQAEGKNLHIVRFRDGGLVNLLLIEKMLAHAHPNPPTSIVDRMMSTYWWHVFHGEVIAHEAK